jgi:hypothetical protein
MQGPLHQRKHAAVRLLSFFPPFPLHPLGGPHLQAGLGPVRQRLNVWQQLHVLQQVRLQGIPLMQRQRGALAGRRKGGEGGNRQVSL